MQGFRRSLVALLVAALIPIAAVTVYQVIRLAQDEKHGVEATTLARANKILELANARLSADIGILQTLTQALALDDGRLANFQELAQRVREQNRGWALVALVDPATDQQAMNTQWPLSDMPLPAMTNESYRRVVETSLPAIGGVTPRLRQASPLVAVRVPVLRDGKLRYILSAGISPEIFQEILLSHMPGGGAVAAIVDREGLFIARSRDPEQWLGKAATEYVRNAIAGGKSGVYLGRTHEGFENYTVFNTSSFSGWSVHIALGASAIDTAYTRAVLVASLAGFACLVMVGALVFLVRREWAEQRRAEATLHQMQRLEALGKMTGGIAHDFNNLLAIIIGNIEMMRRRLGEGLPPQVERIAQAAERGEKLVRQMLAFARRQPLRPQAIDPNAHIRGMSDLFKRAVRGDITLVFDLPNGVWPIEADPVQLESAVLNLAINARDAMPNGGTLRIATRNVPMLEPRRGDFVEVAVADTGTGIAPENLAKVFDPFFTTKAPGEGTGLGLSMVHGFAGQSGGTAEIESQLGQGTTVRLRLPRAAQSSVPAEAARDRRATAPGRGNILVVEDNAELREMTVQLLEGIGYQVRQAETAAEGLSILQGFAADLIFSDILMPGGINGIEFAREACRRYPGVEIVLATGDAGALSAAERSEFTILQKPYRIDALSDTIQRALEHPSDRSARRAAG